MLSAADSELATLQAAFARIKPPPFSLRLTNLLELDSRRSVEQYLKSVAAKAKLIVARVLGGSSYWQEGVSGFHRFCAERKIKLALVSGSDYEDADLAQRSTLDAAPRAALWQYLSQGGAENAEQFLKRAAVILGKKMEYAEAKPMAPALLYGDKTLKELQAVSEPKVAVLFYRALVQSANTRVADELMASLRKRGMEAVAVAVTSLKDPAVRQILDEIFNKCPPRAVIDLTGFAGGEIGENVPALQAICATDSQKRWRRGKKGLSPRDIAMGVALPELDGRIISRAIAFKSPPKDDKHTRLSRRLTLPLKSRVEFVSDQAEGWINLAKTPPAERKIAVILANYPNKNGRIGNGVGLDAPASLVGLMAQLKSAGYRIPNPPKNSDALMQKLLANPTNRLQADRKGGVAYPLTAYRNAFAALPASARKPVEKRWGKPQDDPFVANGSFVLPLTAYGNIWVGIQPARGYNIDPQKTFHDPELPPPHGYLAFYFYLRSADALIHLGKHGNAEWLPGKSLALSEECFPEIVGGSAPNFYPFIVNDPGEGSQAKRRLSTVIIDHLTPPLRRAELHGELARLEALTDEYSEAAATDPRRLEPLREKILSIAGAAKLGDDCELDETKSVEEQLARIDDYLCVLKERQIRDGLHVLGVSPEGKPRAKLLLAIARANRGEKPHQRGLTTALAEDFRLKIDPLSCEMSAEWPGPKPAPLQKVSRDLWRSYGDTVERLEAMALQLITEGIPPKLVKTMPKTAQVLDWLNRRLAPALDSCGKNEIRNLKNGLDGGFVPAGPSGAPSRGRPEVLPTGRNFYSVDPRSLPTPTAWALGWRSASRLAAEHEKRRGQPLRRLGLSAWGTSNMRTGGDDISQAMALLGCRPRWDDDSGRVVGFEVLPLEVLGRGRVDVTLRVSGFFRDAFANLIALFDEAVRAVATLKEDPRLNPLVEGRQKTPLRIFGPKPGAYGAGLQALIDENGWQNKADLAKAYLKWSDTAYTARRPQGQKAKAALRQNLKRLDAVAHNQDNYEHDILDSDDYYQFIGGMTAAANTLSGKEPAVYMNDHSVSHSPRIQTLKTELGKVVRSRATNPLWLKGVMRHGYRGAAEIAATVDYLFAFAATTESVGGHHFDALFAAYLEDEKVRRFIKKHNPAALEEITARFKEAMRRGLWQPKSNRAIAALAGNQPEFS